MTHSQHRSRLANLMRPHDVDDRRHYQRFEQHGLMVRIGDKLHDVHDVSVGGIRVATLDAAIGTVLSMTLFPRDGRQLGLSQSMAVRGEVVGHVGAWTRIRFASMSYTLAKFLIQHLARRNGVQPYIFK
ncbi:MAG TPA: hypothetical protein VK196_16670 [Magnetospirillum sp.]|nr:hypothetical protein [Magnetospirillum sp.]